MEHFCIIIVVFTLPCFFYCNGNDSSIKDDKTAITAAEEEFAAKREELGEEDPETVRALGFLAALYQTQRDYNKAEELYRECLDINQRTLGSDHASTLETMSNLGSLYYAANRYEEAEKVYKSAFDISSQSASVLDKADNLKFMNNLAMVYKAQGKYKQSEPLFKSCLGMHTGQSSHIHTISIYLLYTSTIYLILIDPYLVRWSTFGVG